MSNLDNLVQVTVTASAATPTKPGFGTVLVAAQKVPVGFTARTRKFGSLKEMSDFGFLVTDPAYLCAQKMWAQNPAPQAVIVGRRLNKNTQTITLTCTSAVATDGYAIAVGANPYVYAVPNTGSPTTSTVAAAFAALIDADAAVAASATGPVITVTAPQGTLVDFSAWSDNIQFADTTADPGLAADLAAIQAATNLDWYGLALDSNSKAEIGAGSLFVESAKKIALFTNSDWGCADADTTTDAMSASKTAAYARSGVIFSKRQLLAYSGPALMAQRFAASLPGQDTWMFKTLATVNVDTLSDSEHSAIITKNGNTYEQVSNINITQEGTSGAGEYLDIVRFIDWQTSEVQFRVFTLFVQSPKVPYTDVGIRAVKSAVLGALGAGADQDGLVRESITATFAKAADIDKATKGSRRLSGTFGGELQGAIHHLALQGTLVP